MFRSFLNDLLTVSSVGAILLCGMIGSGCASRGPANAVPAASAINVEGDAMDGVVAVTGSNPQAFTNGKSVTSTCGGVYIAPYTVVTTVTAIPNGVTYGRDHVLVSDGSEGYDVESIEIHDRILVIRTDEHGDVLRAEPNVPERGSRVTAQGYEFTARDSAAWLQRGANVVIRGVSFGVTDEQFVISAPPLAGTCGTPVFDAKGRLVGITDQSIPHEGDYVTTVISARALMAAARMIEESYEISQR